MKPIERIEQIIEHYNTNISQFEKRCNLSNNSIGAAIRRGTSVKDETLNSVLTAYPEVDAGWLLTGEGEMLKNDPNSNLKNNPSSKNGVIQRKDIWSFSVLEILENIEDREEEFLSSKEFQRFLKRMDKLNYRFGLEKEIEEIKRQMKELGQLNRPN